MVRVGIITFHAAENAGAVLQCVALQHVLSEIGADVYVIDYQPEYLRKQYRVLINPFQYSRSKHLKGCAYIKSVLALGRNNFKAVSRVRRKKKFTLFREKWLHLTETYYSYNALKSIPPEADLYISGSDQLWNSDLTGGQLDPAFFLLFGKSDACRATYAISIGKTISDEEADNIVQMSRHLDEISFREPSLCVRFAPMMPDQELLHCVDPTLLVDRTYWMQMIDPSEPASPYILVYALQKNAQIYQVVKQLTTAHPDWEVIDISQIRQELPKVTRSQLDNAPDRFLSLIFHASYIVTNSFHCTVFSTVFHREFTVVAHTQRNSRIHDFLTAVGLNERMQPEHPADTDWKEVDQKIQQYRARSLAYLAHLVDRAAQIN